MFTYLRRRWARAVAWVMIVSFLGTSLPAHAQRVSPPIMPPPPAQGLSPQPAPETEPSAPPPSGSGGEKLISLNFRDAPLDQVLQLYAENNRAEFRASKTKVLTFGSVGFRLSTSISLPRAKEKLEEIIRRLKARQMTDCIVVKEEVSKEALKKYGEDTVHAVGATWKQQDVFGYELNFSKLELVKAGQ